MTPTTSRRRAFASRPRPAAFCLLALAGALLITAALFRSAQSRQTPADPASDALPQLNKVGRHAAEAAEAAKQIKARYAPTDLEYLDARRRYEAAAERFDALVELLALSIRDNSGAGNPPGLREQSRLAVEAGDSFCDWVEGALQLHSRGRGAQRRDASQKADEVVEAAAQLRGAYGRRSERARERTVEAMDGLVKFKRWDEIPPVSAPEASPSPEPSPTPVPAVTPS